MFLIYSFVLLMAIFVNRTANNNVIKIFRDGGYTLQLCSVSQIQLPPSELIIKCTTSAEVCTNGNMTLCVLGCGFKHATLKYNGNSYKIQEADRPVINLEHNTKTYYKSGDHIIFNVQTLLNSTVLQTNAIEIFFSNNISCSSKWITNKTIKCILDVKDLNQDEPTKVNITFRFGSDCNRRQFIGYIQVRKQTRLELIKRYYWTLIILFPIIILVIVYYIVSKNKTSTIRKNRLQMKLVVQESKYTQAQRKAFLDYQISVTSFPNFGKFSPQHLHSFEEYMVRVLNVDFKTKLNKLHADELESFKSMLLNKNQLIVWIKQVEMGCRIQDRFLVSAYLTIFLFQYPEYFLEVMKDLLTQLAMELKIKAHRVMFQKPEYLIEMVVSNWLKLVMYDSLKDKFIGERLFNLYRAVKCKINAGLVDHFTHKAKYAICSDYLLTTNHDYETLKIKATVKVEMKLMNTSEKSVSINLENILVEVLSLDTISQAIAKILDRAIMEDIEFKTSNNTYQQGCQGFALTEYDNYLLYFEVNNVRMLLRDFDHTSIATNIENRECIVINTMKHYNIKSGTHVVLTSHNISSPGIQLSNKVERRLKVHLVLPKQCAGDHQETQRLLSTESQKNLIFEPLIDSDDKVSHYMILLGTKKSLYPFINCFLQCITDWNPKETLCPSKDSLFTPNEESRILEEPSLSSNADISQPNYVYVAPVFYLFSILDEIGNSFNMENNVKLNLWKSHCLMHQFWMPIVQNPDFIFYVDKSIEVTESLKTIADILNDTCLWTLGNGTPDRASSPAISKLFQDDIKNYYVHWWQSFIDRSHPINKADVINIMSNIIQQYQVDTYNSCALNNLHIISRTLLLEKHRVPGT